MKYELIKDGKRIYVARDLESVKRVMAKEVLGLSDRQAYDPSFEPENYSFNKLYKPFVGRSIMITKIDDGEIDSTPVKDEDDTLPWFVINVSNSDGDVVKPIAQSQKKEKILKKLHSLNVWIDDFKFGETYESENNIFYTVTEQENKIGERMVTPHERTVLRKDRSVSTSVNRPSFVSRKGREKTKSTSTEPNIPDVVVDSIKKIMSGSPFFLSKLNVEGSSVFTKRTDPSTLEIVGVIKESFPKIDYWIFHEDKIAFFKVEDKWYSIGDVSFPFGKIFNLLVKSEQFSV